MKSPSSLSEGEEMPLFKNLLLEWTCAVTASFTVAPMISIVDRAIIENASGTTPLMQGLQRGFGQLFQRPVQFMRQPAFLLIWGVYAGTYICGNTIDMLCQRRLQSAIVPKFIGSSVANVGLSVAKDRIFTQMFGSAKSPNNAVKGKFPPLSFALFASRDSLTILAGFILPSMVAARMYETVPSLSKSSIDIMTQLTVPCAMQFLSCPMHLMGIDLYNRPAVSSTERWSLIRREYWKTAWARVGRIFPAYGVGGVLNKKLRHMAAIDGH